MSSCLFHPLTQRVPPVAPRVVALFALLPSILTPQLLGREQADILKLFCKPLTIKKAFRTARSNRNDQRAREQETRKRKADSLAELSAYLPQLKLSTAYITGSRSDDILRERVNVFAKNRVYLTVYQTLINLAGPIQNYRIARQETYIAQLDELLNNDRIHWEVERDFITLWKLTHKHPYIAATKEAASSLLALEKNRMHIGLRELPGALASQARFADDRRTVARYTDDIGEAWTNMQTSVAHEVPEPLSENNTLIFVDEAIIFGAEHDLDFYVAKAKQYRKELQIKAEEIKREQIREELYTKSYLPSVSAYVQLDRGGLISWFSPIGVRGGTIERRKAPLWQLGVEFNWEFDGLANAHKAVGAQAAVAKAIAERNDTFRTIKREVENGYAQMGRQLTDLDAAERTLIAAEQIYAKEEARAALGLLSAPELDAARQSIEGARFAYTEAKSDAALASRELLYKCGYPNITDATCATV